MAGRSKSRVDLEKMRLEYEKFRSSVNPTSQIRR